jgi:uncharacterized membrane protein
MNKYEFLYKLNQALGQSSAKERQEVVKYYDELIQDAIDNGENETAFIEKLGSVDKIVRTLRTDRDFVTNVKEKKDYQLQTVFSVSVKIIGYFVLVGFIFVIGSLGVSLVATGVGMMVYAGIELYHTLASVWVWNTVLVYGGTFALGLGLFLVGIGVFRWIIRESKNHLEKLMEFIAKVAQPKSKKEGESNE